MDIGRSGCSKTALLVDQDPPAPLSGCDFKGLAFEQQRDAAVHNVELSSQVADLKARVARIASALAVLETNVTMTTSQLHAHGEVLRITAGPLMLCRIRNRMRWLVLELLHVKEEERAQRIMHWESYWATVSSQSEEGVKEVFGQEIYNFLFINSKTNHDIADVEEETCQSIKLDASAEVRKIYLDIIDSAETSEVRLGAGKAYCWIYGAPSIEAARAAVSKELVA